MGDRDLKYRILGDNLLGRAVGGAVGMLGKLSRAGLHAAGSMVSGMTRILKRGLQVGFAGTIAGAIWSVKDAMAVGEIESKFDAVFKALSGVMRDWSKDFAKSTKRSEYDVRQWMSSIQDTLVPMGLARGEAAKMSQEITALGVDLGSFNDMDSGEAIERIIGALVGNHENVRKFGVVITEASMKAEAAAMGFGKANKPLSEQEKLLVRLKMIQKGTTDAQGDAVRTSGELANSWRGVLAIFKTWRVEVGNQIVKGLELNKVFGAMERGIGGFIAKMKESGIVQEWAAKVKGLLIDIAAVGKAMATPGKSGDVMKAVANLLWAALVDGMTAAVRILLKAIPVIALAMANGVKSGLLLDKDLVAEAKDLAKKKGTKWRDEVDALRPKYLAKDGDKYAGMIGGGGSNREKAWNHLKEITKAERAQIQATMEEPAAKSKWEDVDQTSLDSLRKHFQDIGDPRSDESLIENYLKKAESPAAARKRDGMRGWSDGDVSGKGGIWSSMRNRWNGTREQNQNMQGLSGWGGGKNMLGAGQSRKGVDLGEIFTRIHGQGAGGGKPPEVQQVDLLKQIDAKLGKIEGKPTGGMRP